MLSIETIIKRIREAVHDEREIGYEDETILTCINGGIRFLRRTIKDYRPSMLVESPIIGTLQAGENYIDLDVIPTKFIDVRINNERINSINMVLIEDLDRKGTPVGYYQTGLSTIHFYPTPNREVSYRILVVGDFKEVGLEDSSPYPNDFDDFLIEYAVIRLGLGNEFNMAQETELMSTIHEQIKKNLLGFDNVANLVSGYFDPLPGTKYNVGGY